MSLSTTADLLGTLRALSLLDAKQLTEAASLQAAFPDPRTLAKELLRRDWLTPYQVNLLLQGKGQQLALGPYILLERRGEGGMGEVFKARHVKMRRIVAIKLIRKERLAKPEAIKRFHREVRAVAQLSHPNIVHAFDADQFGEKHLLVMEYVDGPDLGQLIKKQGKLSIPQACDCIRQAALGLQHAFEQGLVHRDIKPSNLLLAVKTNTVKIADLGLARIDELEGEDSLSNLTDEGAILGTLDFLSPEQGMESHAVDIRSDLYSLGCTFYLLLTGQVPFPDCNPAEKMYKHQFTEPVPARQLRPEIPESVAAIVARLMAKKPEDRFQTPGDLTAALSGGGPAPLPKARLVRRKTTDFTLPPVAVLMTESITAAYTPLAVPVGTDSTIATGATRAAVGHQPRPKSSPPWRRALGWLSVGLIGLTVLIVCGMMLFGNASSGKDTRAGTQRTATPKVTIDLATVVKDPGFETPSVGTGRQDAFRAKPVGSPWTFTGTAGIAGNASGYTAANPAAPQGIQVAFLQNSSGMSQTVLLPTGTYCLEFQAAQRKNTQASSQTFRVLVDGKLVSTFTPMGNTYTPQVTSNFTVTEGSHTIAFEALNPRGGDNTIFIDMVQVALGR